ncbi:uncharacterized protein [Macrobrachium rosenbergii]|uniref:uncharacterized protein isoform X2 n=1 Tax=Macrobrachium rosenbergii TaxID=79674 RepID=UPI0034D640E5
MELGRPLHEGNETGLSWVTTFQLCSIALLGFSYILIGISTLLIVHLLRAKKERPRAISDPGTSSELYATQPPTTSRNDRTLEANLSSVRFTRNRKSENLYEDLDAMSYRDADVPTYNEIEVCEELEAFYDSMCGRDSILMNNLDSPDADSAHKTLNKF